VLELRRGIHGTLAVGTVEMTQRNPDSNHDNAEQAQDARPRRAKRKPTEPQYYIYFCPEGKTGKRVGRGSQPLDVDPHDYIEESSHCEAGLFRIEKKRGGEFSGEVSWYTKEEDSERGLDLNRHAESDESISYLEDTSTPNNLDAAGIAHLVSAAVNTALDARERARRTEQGQPNILDIMREQREQDRAARVEMREEMHAMMPKENPAPRESELDDRTRLELAAVRSSGVIPEIFRSMKDLMHAPDAAAEPESMGDKLLGLVHACLPFVAPYVAPAVGAKLTAVVSRLDTDAIAQRIAGQVATPPQQPAPTMQPPQAPSHGAPAQAAAQTIQQADPDALTFDDVIEGIKVGILEDESPDESIKDIIALRAEQPEYASTIDSMLAMANEELLPKLELATGAQLSQLSNTASFIDGLRAGVMKRLQPREVHASASMGGSNGKAEYAKAG
jgi:hypothetical protein